MARSNGDWYISASDGDLQEEQAQETRPPGQEGLRKRAPPPPGRAAPARGVDPPPQPPSGGPLRRKRHRRQRRRHQADDRAAQPKIRTRRRPPRPHRTRALPVVLPALHLTPSLSRRDGPLRPQLVQ